MNLVLAVCVLQGMLHVSQRSPQEAVVQVGGGSDMVLGRLVRVCGREAINRALQGDRVAGVHITHSRLS